nr:DUF2946 family protein [Herbaspirillum sp. ASV7]
MDEIVHQAMRKWPDVPHCFGWLRLDGRGAWRMRDERAQQLDLAGEPIRHPALLAFIARNYGQDEQGRWYFQNGPQRVYVDIEWMPRILRTQPAAHGGVALQLHTGEAFGAADAAWMDEQGRLYLRAGDHLAGVDDRDLAHLLPALQVASVAGTEEEALLRWLEGDDRISVQFCTGAQALPLQRISAADIAQRFGFVACPRQA